MYAIVLAALAASPAQPPAKHEEQNPLYKELLETGLQIGGDEKAKFKLPAPTMPDGLDAAAQKKLIESVAAGDVPLDEFTRKGVNTPYLMKIRTVKDDPKLPIRGVDIWFIAHGDYKLLQDDKFLERVLSPEKGKGNNKGGPLPPAALKQRGIVIKDPKREDVGTAEFDFLEKVRLKVTGHAMWSRNDESVVAAAEVDPRFLNDKQFPNQWQSIDKAGGETKYGPPQPWPGAAMYLKITRLKEPADGLFIEQHVIFAEPYGWFEGANLLRSKLPHAAQRTVRTMREELQKAK